MEHLHAFAILCGAVTQDRTVSCLGESMQSTVCLHAECGMVKHTEHIHTEQIIHNLTDTTSDITR